jgi:hypothetical protein
MKKRQRIYYTEAQKAVMWEPWKKGESLHQIAELFNRNHSSIQHSCRVWRHSACAETTIKPGIVAGRA